jgi:hypothetical protein
MRLERLTGIPPDILGRSSAEEEKEKKRGMKYLVAGESELLNLGQTWEVEDLSQEEEDPAEERKRRKIRWDREMLRVQEEKSERDSEESKRKLELDRDKKEVETKKFAEMMGKLEDAKAYLPENNQ